MIAGLLRLARSRLSTKAGTYLAGGPQRLIHFDALLANQVGALPIGPDVGTVAQASLAEVDLFKILKNALLVPVESYEYSYSNTSTLR